MSFRFSDKEVEIKVQGLRPENILFLIHEVFESLVSTSFHGVRYDYSIPCKDCISAVRFTVISYKIDHLYESKLNQIQRICPPQSQLYCISIKIFSFFLKTESKCLYSEIEILKFYIAIH